MGKLEQAIEIANPQHPHCATVLLLDSSGSMAEQDKIGQLNAGLVFFKQDVSTDELARKRVDLAVVTFGETVAVAHGFSSIDAFEPPRLGAAGATPMGEAILRGIDLVEERKRDYKQRGVDYYRPWIFLITDGAPTDMKPTDRTFEEVKRRIQAGEEERRFLFFAVGVEPADFATLRQLCPQGREPVQLQRGKFKDLFAWISRSQQRVSASRPGEEVTLESPIGPRGWGKVPN